MQHRLLNLLKKYFLYTVRVRKSYMDDLIASIHRSRGVGSTEGGGDLANSDGKLTNDQTG